MADGMLEQTLRLRRGHEQIVYTVGTGDPVLWLHDLNGVTDDNPLVASLAEHYTVIAPQAPGFAHLEELDDIRNVHELALHYDDVLQALGVGPIDVVGHSFGAMIGAELAAHFPLRVSRLVLLAPLGLWNEHYPIGDLLSVPYPALPEFLYARPPGAAGPDAMDVEALVRIAQGMTSVAKFIWPIPEHGLSRRLDRYTGPTMVMFGGADEFIPSAYADDWTNLLPNVRRAILPHAKHMLPADEPAEVSKLVLDFLSA